MGACTRKELVWSAFTAEASAALLTFMVGEDLGKQRVIF